MTRAYIEYTDGDFITYNVEVIYERGSAGSYTQAPEPHTVEVLEVYNLETDRFLDYLEDAVLWQEIDEYIYNLIDNNEI